MSCGGGISLLGDCESPVCHKQSITALSVVNHSRICRNPYYYISVPMLSFLLLSNVKVTDESYEIMLMYKFLLTRFMAYPSLSIL